MEYIIYAVIMIVASLAAYYMAMRQKQKAPDPGVVTQPTVNQGDRFAVLFGTRDYKAPKCVWMGPTTVIPIQK